MPEREPPAADFDVPDADFDEDDEDEHGHEHDEFDDEPVTAAATAAEHQPALTDPHAP